MRSSLLRVDDEIHAFDNACPHQGNPLVDGDVRGDQLECAYHGWRFDLAHGRVPRTATTPRVASVRSRRRRDS